MRLQALVTFLLPGTAREPLLRIDWLRTAPQLKIKACLRLAAAVANRRNNIARCDPVARVLEDGFVISVERHEALAVVDDDQIVGQFLIETIVLSTTGGLIGIGIGFLIPRLITHFAGMPTVIRPGSLVLSLGISMTVGILFGIYPAYRAAELDPIEALRHE